MRGIVLSVVFLAACSTATPAGGGGGAITTYDVGGKAWDSSAQDTQAPPACVDDCDNAGAPYCTPTGKVAMCILGGDGCKHSGTPEACDAAAKCIDGKCHAQCKGSDNSCTGDVLHACQASGEMKDTACGQDICVAAGFLGYDKCGANQGGNAMCLCVGCTAKDNVCVAGGAQVCDAATGKVSVAPCAGGTVCKSGACIVPCKDECMGGVCDASGQLVGCAAGVDGCKKKLAPQPCSGGLVCKPGGTACTACSAQSDCDAASVCDGTGHCVAAAGATYVLTIVSGSMPLTDTAGASWDGFGGAPDPYVVLKVNDQWVATTKTQQDTFTPAWNESFTFKILSTDDKVSLDIWDEDAASNDWMDGVYFKAWLSKVKAGGGSGPMYTGSTMSLTYAIQPK